MSNTELDTGVSQPENGGSLPKSDVCTRENAEREGVSSNDRMLECQHDVETMAYGKLRIKYAVEYKTWSNCKNRAPKLVGIDGEVWSPELNSFAGFLRLVGPRTCADHSLDRINPEHGYVLGNLRWASKRLQSENRRNVDVYEVNGTPMFRREVAEHLGMSVNALRMRLRRGATIAELVDQQQGPNIPTSRSQASQIEACPWPSELVEDWEQCFAKERERLLPQHLSRSRSAFFVAKCQQRWKALNEEGQQFYDLHGPDTPVPKDLKLHMEYWTNLRQYAWSQLDIVLRETEARPYNIEPTTEDLSDLNEFLQSDDMTDEEVGRED